MLKPLNDKVLLRKLTDTETIDKRTELGIIIPDSVKQQTDRVFLVIAVGPETKEVKVNDKVVVQTHSMIEKIEEFALVKESDIVAVFEN